MYYLLYIQDYKVRNKGYHFLNHEYYGRICPQGGFRGSRRLINEVLSALTTLKEVNRLPAVQDVLMIVSGHGYDIEPQTF
jgi:hypothetical protein